jgi:DNA-binding NtrC family response regulator
MLVPDKLLSGCRVLVVEDEMMVLSLLEAMLANLGASVSSAGGIDQALALIATRVFDVALLDVNLDGINSYPVADSLAAHDVPFIFATGHGNLSMRADYRDRPLLKKPYKFQTLVDTLLRLLSHTR